MSERNYYVICDDNCKFEGMTKEQVYDAIAEATGSTPTPVDEAFITKVKEQNANHSIKFWKGTEAQYNALTEKDTDTVYIIGTNEVWKLGFPNRNFIEVDFSMQSNTQKKNIGSDLVDLFRRASRVDVGYATGSYHKEFALYKTQSSTESLNYNMVFVGENNEGFIKNDSGLQQYKMIKRIIIIDPETEDMWFNSIRETHTPNNVTSELYNEAISKIKFYV